MEISSTKGKSASNLKLIDEFFGKNKQPQDPIVLKDPDTGKQVVTPEEIKKVSLNYCKNLLNNKDPKEAYVDHVKHMELMHDIRMRETIEDDLKEMPLEAFNKAVEAIKRKQGKYDFFKKAGNTLYPALWNLFSTVWKTENIPSKWTE